jgi:hypothetical protein
MECTLNGVPHLVDALRPDERDDVRVAVILPGNSLDPDATYDCAWRVKQTGSKTVVLCQNGGVVCWDYQGPAKKPVTLRGCTILARPPPPPKLSRIAGFIQLREGFNARPPARMSPEDVLREPRHHAGFAHWWDQFFEFLGADERAELARWLLKDA